MASLIKVGSGKVPPRAVQFVDVDRRRRTIRLGKVGLVAGREFKGKVEGLLSYRILNQPPDAQISEWLSGLPDETHQKLATVGLVEPRTPQPGAPALGAWLTKYIDQRRPELKPASVVKLERTKTLLLKYFGESVGIDAITPDAAHDWRAALLSDDMREATIRTHVRNVRAMFRAAVKRKLSAENPFDDLVGTVIAAERDHYVGVAEAEAVLEELPNPQWRCLFGLARLAGLRIPSETHRPTWTDIDFERGRLAV